MRTLSLAVLILGLMLPIAQAEVQNDIAGWSDTRWGMSPADLAKLHPDFTIGVDNYGSTAGRVPDVSIAGSQFQVYLMFDGVGGLRKVNATTPEPPQDQWRLVRVELRGPEEACYRVTESLLGKYGQPTKHEGDFYLWVLPTTTVRKVEFSGCGIIYHPSDKNDNL